MDYAYYKNKNVLVTGGAGFIGTNLCIALRDAGASVVSIDNYFMGSRDNHQADVTYIEGHSKDIASLINIRPDLIFHLAEYSRVAESMNEPAVVFDFNLSGTTQVLEYCRINNVKLVYGASSTKYAKSREDGIEGKHLSPYTFAKSMMSDLVESYGSWYNLDYSIAYFYNVYGKYERSDKYGTVIEIFKNKFLNNEPLPVRLPGTQTRNYTSVLDTVNALLLIGEKGKREEYFICASEAYGIKEVAEMFVGAHIDYLEARSTSRPSGEGDSTTLKGLGWEQKHMLKDYINEIVNSKA